jgi:two-component system chemotaxis response regulator CheB
MNAGTILAIGVQTGARHALLDLLRQLPRDWPTPVLVACPREEGDDLHQALWAAASLPVIEPYDKDGFKPGFIYVRPAHYELLSDTGFAVLLPEGWAQGDGILDRFFQSVADAHGKLANAVLLAAKGSDGLLGLDTVRTSGGRALSVDTSEGEGVSPAALEVGP